MHTAACEQLKFDKDIYLTKKRNLIEHIKEENVLSQR